MSHTKIGASWKSWSTILDGFREHIALDGSLKRVSSLTTTKKKKNRVCDPWYDAGGVERAENDQYKREVWLFYHGAGKTVWAALMGWAREQTNVLDRSMKMRT